MTTMCRHVKRAGCGDANTMDFREGEPPCEPSAIAGSDGASPSRRRHRDFPGGRASVRAECQCRLGRSLALPTATSRLSGRASLRASRVPMPARTERRPSDGDIATFREGEPPCEPSANAGSDGASPFRRRHPGAFRERFPWSSRSTTNSADSREGRITIRGFRWLNPRSSRRGSRCLQVIDLDRERTKRRNHETEDAIGDYPSFCDFFR
jgi:hypothetical protein